MKYSEDQLIETIRRAVGKPSGGGVRGIGDDAAVLRCAGGGAGRGKRLLLASDMLVDGTHFKRKWITPAQLGWKALAVNLSDIAAMGGEPLAALVSLGLPKGAGEGFVREFYRGMKKLAAKFGVDIVGGDTVRAAALTVDVAVCGEVEEKRCVYRSGAKAGDVVMVTGALGDSAAGLKILNADARSALECGNLLSLSSQAMNRRTPNKSAFSKDENFLIKKHLQPTPRIAEGREAASGGATAMMDLSDGLAADLPRLAKASGVGARIYEGALPASPALRRIAGDKASAHAATGGEDYELLFCAPKNKAEKLSKRIKEKTGTKVTAIGEIVPARRACRMVGTNGKERPLPKPGFLHF